MSNPRGHKNALLLVDGLNIIFRAHYALAQRPLQRATDGKTISGIAGFCSTMLRIVQQVQPRYLAVGMDSPG